MTNKKRGVKFVVMILVLAIFLNMSLISASKSNEDIDIFVEFHSSSVIRTGNIFPASITIRNLNENATLDIKKVTILNDGKKRIKTKNINKEIKSLKKDFKRAKEIINYLKKPEFCESPELIEEQLEYQENGGTVNGKVYGFLGKADVESGVTVTDNVYGGYFWADYDGVGNPQVHSLRVQSYSNVDYNLYLGGGGKAYCSEANCWTDASARELKRDIAEVEDRSEYKEIAEDFKFYTYKMKPHKNEEGVVQYTDERTYVGWMADEIPESCVTEDGMGTSPTCVLTHIAIGQQEQINELKGELCEKDNSYSWC